MTNFSKKALLTATILSLVVTGVMVTNASAQVALSAGNINPIVGGVVAFQPTGDDRAPVTTVTLATPIAAPVSAKPVHQIPPNCKQYLEEDIRKQEELIDEFRRLRDSDIAEIKQLENILKNTNDPKVEAQILALQKEIDELQLKIVDCKNKIADDRKILRESQCPTTNGTQAAPVTGAIAQ